MKPETLRALFDELTKIGGTAFSSKQYQKLYGPKIVRKNKQFTSGKDTMPNSQFQTLTPDNGTYNPISSASRVAEGRETPGGPF